jgi:hypothetical protein
VDWGIKIFVLNKVIHRCRVPSGTIAVNSCRAPNPVPGSGLRPFRWGLMLVNITALLAIYHQQVLAEVTNQKGE